MDGFSDIESSSSDVGSEVNEVETPDADFGDGDGVNDFDEFRMMVIHVQVQDLLVVKIIWYLNINIQQQHQQMVLYIKLMQMAMKQWLECGIKMQIDFILFHNY